MLQKNPSKKNFYEKIEMFNKGPFVVESFVIVGSFDYDCTPKARWWQKHLKENCFKQGCNYKIKLKIN
jgi:hypothetical protein